MRVVHRTAAVVAAAVGVGCAPAEETPEQVQARMQADTEAFRAAIGALQTKYEQWEGAGMVDSVVSVYAENAVVAFPHQPLLRGHEALRESFSQLYSLGTVGLDLTTQSAMASGPMAVERGTYVQTLAPGPDVPPAMAAMFPDSGNYLVHWHRIDGEWKVSELVVTSQRPAPGMQM